MKSSISEEKYREVAWKITQDNLSLSISRIFHDPLDESVFRVREMLCYHLVKSFSQTRMNWPQNTWWVFEVLCWPEGSITAVVTTGKYNIILFSSKIPIISYLTVVVTTSWNSRFLGKIFARLREFTQDNLSLSISRRIYHDPVDESVFFSRRDTWWHRVALD